VAMKERFSVTFPSRAHLRSIAWWLKTTVTLLFPQAGHPRDC
jgi:hypothetical protein